MMTSNNFSSLKEGHLQLSPWISKVGGYPGEYGEGPSSLEHSILFMAPWLPLMSHLQKSGCGGRHSMLGQMTC